MNEGFDYDPADELDDEDDDLDDECMLMPDGQCMLAGTEWCDFECPNRDSELFAGSAAWHAKHSKTPQNRDIGHGRTRKPAAICRGLQCHAGRT